MALGLQDACTYPVHPAGLIAECLVLLLAASFCYLLALVSARLAWISDQDAAKLLGVTFT